MFRSTPFGLVKIGIRYSVNRKSLSIKVFSCKFVFVFFLGRKKNFFPHRNLIKVHQQNLPDPYVRLILTPDLKKDKRKTRSIHDTLNPVYDDLWENSNEKNRNNFTFGKFSSLVLNGRQVWRTFIDNNWFWRSKMIHHFSPKNKLTWERFVIRVLSIHFNKRGGRTIDFPNKNKYQQVSMIIFFRHVRQEQPSVSTRQVDRLMSF